MEYLASMYIDNELDLDEKIQFVDKISTDAPFYEDTRLLLQQETLLREPPDTSRVPNSPPMAKTIGDDIRKFLKPLVYAAAGFALAALLLFSHSPTPVHPPLKTNRFVLYEPAANQVEVVGSFTGWQRTPMMPIGTSGYWELRLQLQSGEHRFAYILDGTRQLADPTLPVREKDDFGGENSILNVESRL